MPSATDASPVTVSNVSNSSVGSSAVSSSPFDIAGLSSGPDPNSVQNGPEDFLNLAVARHLSQATLKGVDLQPALDLSSLPEDIRQTVSDGTTIPHFTQPNALADVFHQVMSNAAPTIPVTDIAGLETKLMNAGYLPQGPTTGVWAGNKPLQQAFYRANYDAAQQIQSGNGHLGSISAAQALKLLDFMVPNNAIKGVEGFATSIGKSLLGTGGRLLHLVTKHDMAAVKDLEHHWAGDTLNVLSTIGMFTGMGELLDAARVGAGLTGAAGAVFGDAAEEAMSKYGISTASHFLTADPAELAAKPGLINSMMQKFLTQTVSKDVSTQFGDYVAKYGIRRFSESNAGRLGGMILGGTTKAGAFPWAASVLEPKSDLGRAVSSAPGLGRSGLAKDVETATSWASNFVHPETGLSPLGDMKLLAGKWAQTTKFGRMVPLAHTGMTDLEKARTMTQAYYETKIQEAAQNIAGFQRVSPAQKADLLNQARDAIESQVFDSPGTPGRNLKDSFVQEAMNWGVRNPTAVEAYHTSTQADAEMLRQAGGIFNPTENERVANQILGNVNSKLLTNGPAIIEARKQISNFTDKVESSRQSLAKALGVHQRQTALEEARAAAREEPLAEGQTRILPLRQQVVNKDGKLVWASLPAGPPKSEATGQAVSDLTDQLSGHMDQLAEAHALHDRVKAFDLNPATELTDRHRAFLMRIDDMKTSEQASKVLEAWNGVKKSAQEDQQAWIDSAHTPLAQLGLGGVPPSKLESELKGLIERLPHEIRGTDAQEEQLAVNGYKMAVSPHAVLTNEDINPAVGMIPKFKNSYGLMASLGLGLQNASPADLNNMISASLPLFLDRRLTKAFPEVFTKPGVDGYTVRDALLNEIGNQRANLSQVANRGGSFRKAMLAKMYKGLPDMDRAELSDVLKEAYPALQGDDLRHAAGLVFDTIKKTQAMQGMVHSPQETWTHLRDFSTALRLKGLPGVADTIRALSISDMASVAKTAASKAHLQVLANVFSKIPDNWGYLGDDLAKWAFKFRYNLNPLFAARTIEKSETVGLMKEGVPLTLMPRRALLAQGGEDAYKEAVQILSRATGHQVDAYHDMGQTVLGANLLGFNMTDYRAFAAKTIYDREKTIALRQGMDAAGADSHAINYVKQHLPAITNYGDNRPIMKSLNFIFFPLRFEAKFLNAAHDYLTAEPIRAFMVHTLAQRAQSLEKLDPNGQTKIANFVNKHAPILNEFYNLNPFRYGVGLPSANFGPYGSLAKLIGTSPGALAALMSPSAATGQTSQQFHQILNQVVPIAHNFNQLWTDVYGQYESAAHGEAPQEQVNDYYTNLEAIQQKAEGISTQFGGLGTMASFSASKKIPDHYKQQYQTALQELKAKYPAGAAHAAAYSATAATENNSIDAILRMTNKNPAQQGVVALEAMKLQMKDNFYYNYVGPGMKARNAMIQQEAMRAEGLRLLNAVGPSFLYYWDHLGYQQAYGPIASASDSFIPPGGSNTGVDFSAGQGTV